MHMNYSIQYSSDNSLHILITRKPMWLSIMRLYDGFTEILKIQKFRRLVSYTGFYCFTAVIVYAYTNNT